MYKNNYRLPIFVVIAGILVIIVLSVVYVLTDGGSSGKDKAKASGTPAPTSAEVNVTDPAAVVPAEDLHIMNAIIKGIDLDNLMIIAQERETGTEHEFTYNGATDFRTAYNRQITAALLKPGDFVTLSYNDGALLKNVTGSKDVKVYKNISQRIHDASLRKITVGDTIYRYGDDLLVLNEGYFVGIDTLRDMDIISIYSVDDYIFLINVERGHGYFQMINHSYFTGGTLKVGKYISCEITEDLRLTLEEGEYDIVVEHEDFVGEATILIERDYTTRLDMSAYTPESAIMGFCMFDITPASALLYVDGVLTPYDNAVELSHGEHWIQVAAGGYTPYTGFIEIGDSIGSLNIMLSPAPTRTPDILYEEDPENTAGATPAPTLPTSDDTTPGNSAIVDSTSDRGDTLIEPGDGETGGDSGENAGSEGNSGNNDNTGPDSNTGNNGDSGPDGNTGNNGDSGSDGNTGNGENPDQNNGSENDNSNNGNNSNSDGNPDNTTDPDTGEASGNISITIVATEGAAVFIDDTYKGTVGNGMLRLTTQPGPHTVRLTKEGYLTRRYTIYVENDTENTEFTFPAMVTE